MICGKRQEAEAAEVFHFSRFLFFQPSTSIIFSRRQTFLQPTFQKLDNSHQNNLEGQTAQHPSGKKKHVFLILGVNYPFKVKARNKIHINIRKLIQWVQAHYKYSNNTCVWVIMCVCVCICVLMCVC